jgi:hypothetical protein
LAGIVEHRLFGFAPAPQALSLEVVEPRAHVGVVVVSHLVMWVIHH